MNAVSSTLPTELCRRPITVLWKPVSKLFNYSKQSEVCSKYNNISKFLLLCYDREWTENGQLWVQQVSSTPATRLDVVNLQVHTRTLTLIKFMKDVGNLTLLK